MESQNDLAYPANTGSNLRNYQSVKIFNKIVLPVVKWFPVTLFFLIPSNAGGVGSIPGKEAKNPHASGPKKQSIKHKQYCNKFNKDF